MGRLRLQVSIAVQKMQSHLYLRYRKIPVWQVALMEVVFTKAQLSLRKISLQVMMRSFLTKCCPPESTALDWGLQMGWEVQESWRWVTGWCLAVSPISSSFPNSSTVHSKWKSVICPISGPRLLGWTL